MKSNQTLTKISRQYQNFGLARSDLEPNRLGSNPWVQKKHGLKMVITGRPLLRVQQHGYGLLENPMGTRGYAREPRLQATVVRRPGRRRSRCPPGCSPESRPSPSFSPRRRPRNQQRPRTMRPRRVLHRKRFAEPRALHVDFAMRVGVALPCRARTCACPERTVTPRCAGRGVLTGQVTTCAHDVLRWAMHACGNRQLHARFAPCSRACFAPRLHVSWCTGGARRTKGLHGCEARAYRGRGENFFAFLAP